MAKSRKGGRLKEDTDIKINWKLRLRGGSRRGRGTKGLKKRLLLGKRCSGNRSHLKPSLKEWRKRTAGK